MDDVLEVFAQEPEEIKYSGPYTLSYSAPYTLSRATDGSAGIDICASQTAIVPVHGTAVVSTDLYLQLPPGWHAEVRGRSGMASRGIICHNGTIDSDYRGEVKVILHNVGERPYTAAMGDRVAQIIVHAHVPEFWMNPVESPDELSETERDEGGLGSTGR